MKQIIDVFHYLSKLQFPTVLLAIFYFYKHNWYGRETIFEDFNTSMIFLGLAISLGSLSDIERKKSKFYRKVWSNARSASLFLFLLLLLVVIIFGFGFYLMFFIENESINIFASGSIVLGIGITGMIKSGLASAEYEQRKVTDHSIDLFQEL